MDKPMVDSSGAGHATLKGYVTGFVLALVLTIIPFGLVMAGAFPRATLVVWVILAAALQIVVHLHYFLHLDTSSAERWNVMALLFTILIIVILLAGTLWIMYNLRIRMTDGPMAMAAATHPMRLPGGPAPR